MAYELTIQTAENVSSTDLNNNVETDVDTSDLILSDRQSAFSHRESTFNRPAHNYARYYVSDRVDPTTVVSSFEAVVTNADWAEIDGRHVWAEYEQDTYLTDETYYPYGATDILRAPPTVERAGGFDTTVGEAHVLIGGVEYSVSDVSLSVSDVSAEYIRCDAVVVDDTGSVSMVEGQEYPVPKDNDIAWPQHPDTAASEQAIAYVTVKEPLDKIPLSGITIPDVVGTPGDSTVDYSHGTIPDGI